MKHNFSWNIQVFYDVTTCRLVKYLPIFRNCLSASSSGWSSPRSVVCFTLPFFSTSLTNYQSTPRNIPEGLDLQQHSYEKPKRRIRFRCFYQPDLLFYGDRSSFSSDTVGGLWSDLSPAGSAEVKKGCISIPLNPFNSGPSGRAV